MGSDSPTSKQSQSIMISGPYQNIMANQNGGSNQSIIINPQIQQPFFQPPVFQPAFFPPPYCPQPQPCFCPQPQPSFQKPVYRQYACNNDDESSY